MEHKKWTKNTARGLRHCLGLTLSAAALTLLAASHASAQDAGMKVVKDAQTGQLRAPTADEFKKMQAQENTLKSGKKKSLGMLTNTEEPKLVPNRRGGIKMELTEDTMVYSVATRNADGSLTMQCVTGADAAEKALTQTSSSTKGHEGHNHDVK
jgi:hypothetical protein